MLLRGVQWQDLKDLVVNFDELASSQLGLLQAKRAV
jgi:hypothetical protein